MAIVSSNKIDVHMVIILYQLYSQTPQINDFILYYLRHVREDHIRACSLRMTDRSNRGAFKQTMNEWYRSLYTAKVFQLQAISYIKKFMVLYNKIFDSGKEVASYVAQ